MVDPKGMGDKSNFTRPLNILKEVIPTLKEAYPSLFVFENILSRKVSALDGWITVRVAFTVWGEMTRHKIKVAAMRDIVTLGRLRLHIISFRISTDPISSLPFKCSVMNIFSSRFKYNVCVP